jgi:peptidoglycan/xylan/chitin deacetylase (PgdA/CDA1 family)
MFYLVKSPWWLKKIIYPSYTWDIASTSKSLYLSFDDGPHPLFTPYVLDELKKYKAKATFFCIGKNVAEHPEIYQRILNEGHATGNHTHNHLNGWHTTETEYFDNTLLACRYIDSNLFRPPYGRITRFQAKHLQEKLGFKIIMWSVLSGDFDTSLTEEQCWRNIQKSAKKGAVIVFHDSEKAAPRMLPALKNTLEYFSGKGFAFEKIE